MPLRPKWPACQAGALQYSIRFQVQIKQFELNTVNLVQQRCQEGHWQPLAWRLPAWLLLCKLSLCSSVNHTIWEDILQLMATHRRGWWPGSSFPRRMSCDSGLRQEISHTFTTFPKGTAASPLVQQLSGTLSFDLYVRSFCIFFVYQCSSVCVHMCVCTRARACTHECACTSQNILDIFGFFPCFFHRPVGTVLCSQWASWRNLLFHSNFVQCWAKG